MRRSELAWPTAALGYLARQSTWLAAGVLISLPVSLTAQCANARVRDMPGPRLLLVEKEGRMALFLPESHIGSPVQDDAYFRTVIRPAFAASSELLAERAIAPWLDRTYDHAACPDESPAEAALDAALTAAAGRHVAAAPPLLRAIASRDDIGALGRFIRFYRLFTEVHLRALGEGTVPAEVQTHSVRLRNAQSYVLLAGAPRHIATVEDTGTMFTAYCALPPEQRAKLIAATIAQSDADSGAAPAASPAATLQADIYRSIDADYRQTLACMRAALQPAYPAAQGCSAGAPVEPTEPELAINRFMLVERSQAWVAGLPAVMQRERLPFYALGAAHFPDGLAGPGLLTILRAAGYNVTLLTDRRALDTAMARLPPLLASRPARSTAMHRLAGGCVGDGATYGCEWHDPSVSYTVLNPLTAEPQEFWSACFERSGMLGPEKHCYAGHRKAGSERTADVAGHAVPTPAPP